MRNALGIIIATLCLAWVPAQAQAPKANKATKTAQVTKERLVLMPLRVAEEDKSLQGAMETALVEGLQQKYEVFSGEQVAQKAREIFMKESRSTAKKECDETRCMQGIAEAFQAELIATANVTKQGGGYFLALSIQNIFDNKVEYSKTLTCKGCDSFQVVDKLKELVGTPAPVAAAPAAEAPQPKLNMNDSETVLWEEVKKGSAAEDYQAYLSQYPKGKFAILAKTKLTRLKEEARAETEKQEKQTWEDAQQTNSIESYEGYLNDYPKGRYVVLAQGRVAKLKKEQTDEETKQKREQAAEAAKQKREAGNLAAKEEAELWNKADSSNDKAAVENYLTKYPSGRYLAAASAKLKAIKEEEAKWPKYVSQGGLTWMPMTFTKNWADANAYCANTAINGQNGWRLPTKDELSALYASGYASRAMNRQGWNLDYTWSSTPNRDTHYSVNMRNGEVSSNHYSSFDALDVIYVTCVR